MVRSLAAEPLLTVRVGVVASARLPAIVAAVVPAPLTLSVTLPPRVSVPVPVVTLAPEVAPLSRIRSETVLLNPFRANVPPERTVKVCDAKSKALSTPAPSVPLLTVTPPVIATELSSSKIPAPPLFRPPVPVTAALAPRVSVLAPTNSFASAAPNASTPLVSVGWMELFPVADNMLPLTTVSVSAPTVESKLYMMPPDISSELMETLSLAVRLAVSLTLALGVSASASEAGV